MELLGFFWVLGKPFKNSYNLSVQKMTCFVMLILTLSGCRQAEMQTYRVPKEPDSPSISQETPLPESHPPLATGTLPEGHPPLSGELPPGHPEVGGGDMSMANAAAQGIVPSSAPQTELTWAVPKGWQEKPGSGFRTATFVIPGSGSMTGDLSVTVLEGEAGGLLSNVNRWRGQLGLSDLTERQLTEVVKNIRPGGRAMTLVRFASETNLIDGKYKKRLLAAVYSTQGKTWFFKLFGEDQLVQSAEQDFLKFLESVEGF